MLKIGKLTLGGAKQSKKSTYIASCSGLDSEQKAKRGSREFEAAGDLEAAQSGAGIAAEIAQEQGIVHGTYWIKTPGKGKAEPKTIASGSIGQPVSNQPAPQPVFINP